MKTLSIKQPWASLICTPRKENNKLGIKDIENRTWATKHRGTILVHASGKASFNNLTLNLSHEQIDSIVNTKIPLDARNDFFHYSAIIGEVDIVDCVIGHPSIWAEKTEGVFDVVTKEFIPRHTPKPVWNWVLANPVLYDKPILNVKGRLSLWEFNKEDI